MSKILRTLVLGMVVGGCAPSGQVQEGAEPRSPEVPSSRPAEDPALLETCAAKDLQYLVGQPGSVLDTMRFGTVVRIERPGDVMTMEYLADRTRIILGEDGRISRVICG